jgi:hypothetical protein
MRLSIGIIHIHELSPSWEPANCAATQELQIFYGAPKVHYRVTRVLHRFLSWACSIQSISPHSITLRSILILSTHLLLGLPKVSFLLTFPPIFYIHSPSPPFMLHALPISFSFTLSFYLYLARSTTYEVLHYVVFISLPSPHLSSIQIFSSAPSVCVPPLMLEIKFRNHTDDSYNHDY